jgi:hypothetical protein
MRKCFCFGVLVLLSSLSLAAQDKLEVFGGYQYLHNGNITVNGQSQPGSSQGYNGWDASARYKLSKFLGVEGDFSGSYATVDNVSTHIYTYAGGPVISAPISSLKPFAHVLVGGTRLTGSASGVSVSTNGFTLMVGGGVDAKVNKLFSVRLAQVDWLYYHYSGFNIAGVTSPSFSGSNNVRIATGIVLHF